MPHLALLPTQKHRKERSSKDDTVYAFLHTMDLSCFFSPRSGCPPHPLPFTRLALLGPSPPSTVFHLALSFIQKYKPVSNPPDVLQVPAKPHVLLLCTSRSALQGALVEENDEYLALHGGDPSISTLLEENLEIRYLDTMAKWLFWCSAVGSNDEEGVLRLKRNPDLVVVSGLSALLDEDRNKGAGVECYSSLMASTISAFAPSTRFVFLDNPSAAFEAIPLLPSELNNNLRRRRKVDESNGNGKQGDIYTVEPRKMPLEGILHYFCDTVGSFTEHEGLDESLRWFEVKIGRSPRAKAGKQGQEMQEIDVRYALKKMDDESGWSERDRYVVAFG